MESQLARSSPCSPLGVGVGVAARGCDRLTATAVAAAARLEAVLVHVAIICLAGAVRLSLVAPDALLPVAAAVLAGHRLLVLARRVGRAVAGAAVGHVGEEGFWRSR